MKLGEDEVCEIFNVGRTVARQAFQILAHNQLVTIEPNRGAFVAKPSIREAREVFEARALLEPRTAQSAATRATTNDIAILRDHVREEHSALAAGENGTALKLSGQFHIEIARIADQITIEEIIRQLVSRSSLVIMLYWRRRSAMCESNAHDALIGALEAHDPKRAEDLMKGHLVDLVSLLDLHDPASPPSSLREALRL
jgi:DNA-binding GntR family transcriptional regulator